MVEIPKEGPTWDDVDELIQELKDEGYEPSTIDTQIYFDGVEAEILLENPPK